MFVSATESARFLNDPALQKRIRFLLTCITDEEVYWSIFTGDPDQWSRVSVQVDMKQCK